jgi:hypothetical protein
MTTPATDPLLASAAALRPRSASELVDAAFQLVRRHFAPLLAVAMLVWFPIALMQQAAARLGTLGPTAAATLGATIFVATAVWYAVGSAMLARAASDAYVGEGARPVVALRAALARTWDICVSTFVAWVVIVAGLFLIVLLFGLGLAALPDSLTGRVWVALPATAIILVLMLAWAGYFAAYYFAVPAACAIDGLDFSDALKRSRRLSEGRKRHIVTAIMWPYLIAAALFLSFLVAVTVFSPALALVQIVWHALAVLALPLVGAVTAVVYVDARIRRDGLDLEVMAQALAPTSDPQAPGAQTAGAA